MDHQQFFPADKDFAASAADRTDNDTCRIVRRHTAFLTGIHLSVTFPALVECTHRNVRPYAARTNYRNPYALIVIFSLRGLEKAVQGEF